MAVRSIPENRPSKKGGGNGGRSFTPRPVGSTVTRRGNMYRSGSTFRADLGGGRSMYRDGDTYRYEDEKGNEVVRKGNVIRTGKKGKYKYRGLTQKEMNKRQTDPSDTRPKKKIIPPRVQPPKSKRMIPEDMQDSKGTNPRVNPKRRMFDEDAIERRMKKYASVSK